MLKEFERMIEMISILLSNSRFGSNIGIQRNAANQNETQKQNLQNFRFFSPIFDCKIKILCKC